MAAFIPPIKFVRTGPLSECNKYLKFGAGQLAILERQIAIPGLPEGVRRVSPIDGVFVECISSYSNHEVRITVSP